MKDLFSRSLETKAFFSLSENLFKLIKKNFFVSSFAYKFFLRGTPIKIYQKSQKTLKYLYLKENIFQ